MGDKVPDQLGVTDSQTNDSLLQPLSYQLSAISPTSAV